MTDSGPRVPVTRSSVGPVVGEEEGGGPPVPQLPPHTPPVALLVLVCPLLLLLLTSPATAHHTTSPPPPEQCRLTPPLALEADADQWSGSKVTLEVMDSVTLTRHPPMAGPV